MGKELTFLFVTSSPPQSSGDHPPARRAPPNSKATAKTQPALSTDEGRREGRREEIHFATDGHRLTQMKRSHWSIVIGHSQGAERSRSCVKQSMTNDLSYLCSSVAICGQFLFFASS